MRIIAVVLENFIAEVGSCDRQYLAPQAYTIRFMRRDSIFYKNREEIEAMLGLKLEETRVYREAKQEGRGEGRQEGREEGREEEARSLILRQLNKRVGAIPDEQQRQIETLSLEQLEVLAEELLDFASVADLNRWLQTQATS